MQVLRGTFYNEKVDVFSLGIVIWELLSYTPTIAIVTGEGARQGPPTCVPSPPRMAVHTPVLQARAST